MKKRFHSTQDKTWNAVPRSEFLGVAVGFAVGMMVHGALRLDSSLPEIAGIAVGFCVGYLIDRLFFRETCEEGQPDGSETGTTAQFAGDCISGDF